MRRRRRNCAFLFQFYFPTFLLLSLARSMQVPKLGVDEDAGEDDEFCFFNFSLLRQSAAVYGLQ